MPSILLAIDTATEACSAALLVSGAVIERSEIAPRRHAELILPMIEELLNEAGLSRRQIDAVAVGRGPGAFTGVRLAISVAQGLALGLDIPVIPVSSLAALAQEVPPDERAMILAVIDARMGEVYAGAFRRDESGLVQLVGAEGVSAAADWSAPLEATAATASWNVVGSGWNAYREALAARLPTKPAFSDGARYPQARAIARLAEPHFAAGRGIPPEFALPVYLRDKVALTTQEQRQLKSS